MKVETLPNLIHKWALDSPDRTAMRYKRYGIWRTLSWGEFYESVDHLTKGLIDLGMEQGDHLAVIGNNDPEWIMAEFAIMRLAGACVGIYQDMQLEEIVYLVNASKSRIVVAEDQEQADKLIAVWDKIKSNVIKVIIWDSRGMNHYFERHPFMIHIDNVRASGRNSKKATDALQKIVVTPEMTALILPTSGTTSLAKLAMISHTNLVYSAEIWDSSHPLTCKDEFFSLLPLPWMGEQMTIARFLHKGVGYNFPEGQASVNSDFLEIQPTVANMSSKMYEDICSLIRARMEDASFFKRKIYTLSLNLGLEMAERSLEGKRGFVFPKSWLYKLAMFTTLRGLRQRVGLGRIRLAFTGGAAIGREVFTFYRALGMNLMQLYGMTENCGTATCHKPNDVRPETVGVAQEGIEVRVDDDGMIYVKSPTNIQGYYNNSKETAETFKDGWLKTGDAGYFDQAGHLVVLDRQKDLMFLNDGTRFAPQELGNRLNFSPFIKESVVFGDKRDIIAAIISIDMGNVGNWANKRNIVYTTFTDLSQNQTVIALIHDEIGKINLRLPDKMRIHRFALLPKELHPDDEELTRTRKIRRNVINERYGGLIEALYSTDTTHDLDIQITYMDGKSSRLRSKVKLEDV
jgi:long-chain acyl-CoA synthetase